MKLANSKFPTGRLLLLVSLISAALLASALHTFVKMGELGHELLDKQAREVAMSVNRSIPGPQKWSSLALWEQTMDRIIQDEPGTVLFLGVIDDTGRILIRKGRTPPNPDAGIEELKQATDPEIFWYEHGLSQGRGGPPWAAERGFRGSSLLVGISREPAEILKGQAYRHLLISCLTVVSLWILAIYLLRIFRRLLESRTREESAKHLASLGQMSATLAHEIRNPLGAMKGLSQVVLEEQRDDPKTAPLIRTVVNEAERLESLVEDLLAFARPSEPRFEEFEIGALVRKVVELMKPEAEEARVTIQLEEIDPVTIRSDQDGLRQVLLNVLRNAIEASPQQGRIQVRIQQEKKSVELRIRDNGSGLQGADPEELFQPFVTTKAKGSGLGLAVCRRIMGKIGGTIRLEDGIPDGIECIVQIPA